MPIFPRRASPLRGFTQRSAANPRYTFDTAAGRYLVLAFLHDMTDPANVARVEAVLARGDLFFGYVRKLLCRVDQPR